jgi:hypothetical protein
MKFASFGTQKAAARHAAHLGGVRGQIMNILGERIHEEYGQGTSTKPTVIPIRDDAGQVTSYREVGHDGTIHREVDVNDPQAPSFARRALHAATISRVAGSLATRAGLGGAIRAGAGAAASSMAGAGAVGGAIGTLATVGARAIPFVGAAMGIGDAVVSGVHYAQEQRAKNAVYQSVQGGSNFGGFGQRFQEEGFTWSEAMRTGLQSDQARELFKGVSSLGIKDSQRQNMLNFGSDNYRRLGMSVEQSMKAIQIASMGANTGLAGVAQGLQNVSKVAVQTGQSAEVLRDKFLDTMGSTAMAGYGSSSAEVAAAVTIAGPGRGRAFQNVDLSGQFQETQERMTAALMGKDYGAYVADIASGNVGPSLEMKDKELRTQANNALNPEARAFLQDAVAKAGGKEALKNNQNATRQIGIELLRHHVDPGVVESMIDTYAPGALANVPKENRGGWLVDTLLGNNSQADAAQGIEAQNAQRPYDWKTQSFTGRSRVGKLMDTLGVDNVGPSDFVQDNYSWNPFSSEGQERDKSLDAYWSRQNSAGVSDPAIEAMIQKVGNQSEVGVEVQVKDGTRVVSQADAIKYYADQVAKGTATLVGGSADINGKNIADFTGVKEGNFVGPDSTQSDGSQGDGVSKEDWLKDHPTDADPASAGGGKVMLDLTPEAKKLVQQMGGSSTTNPQVEAGAGAGVPPAISGRWANK